MQIPQLTKSNVFDHPTYKTRRDQKAGQILTIDNWAGVENATYTPFADTYIYSVTVFTENAATTDITFTLVYVYNDVTTALQQVTFLSTDLLTGTSQYIPVIPVVQPNEPLANPNWTGVPIPAGCNLWIYRSPDLTWYGNATFEINVIPGADISAGRA